MGLFKEFRNTEVKQKVGILEFFLVGIEQFLILTIVWRLLFFQYLSAAYNIEKFCDYLVKKHISTEAVDLMSYRFELRLQKEKITNLTASTIFVVYAILVSFAYRSSGGYVGNIVLNSFVLLFCMLIQLVGVYFFIKATNVFKNAAREFNLSWNKDIYYTFLVLMTAEVSATLIWSILAFSSSFLHDRNN